MPTSSTFAWTTAALVAFAANSLLCRFALGEGMLDAASFTSVRLVSGALALSLMVGGTRQAAVDRKAWGSALALFFYAASFSLAYLELGAAVGTLLFFGVVQVTMVGAGLAGGERPGLAQWVGLLTAVSGLATLVAPGLAGSGPSLWGALAMLAAGISWGVYSHLGRGSRDAAGETATRFQLAVPMTLLFAMVSLPELHLSATGVALAACSGIITSALGYVVWFIALKGLNGVSAASVQLAVPLITTIGAVVLLGESLSLRFLVSALMVLAGIALVIAGKCKRSSDRPLPLSATSLVPGAREAGSRSRPSMESVLDAAQASQLK